MKINPEISLRNWQNKAFNLWLKNDLNGIFSVVTGGGKTIFGLICLSHLFEKKVIDATFIIVPTRTLQDQWASNILKFTNSKMGDISFNFKKLNKINILTNLSAQKIPFQDLKNRYSIILDECHRYGTEKNLKFLDKSFYGKIGLTATLTREYDNGVQDILVPNIGKKIYDYGIKEALDDGVVENYKMIYLRTHFNGEEQDKYSRLNKRIGKLYNIKHNGSGKGWKGDIDTQIKMLLYKRSHLVNKTNQRTFVAANLILNNINRKKIIFCETINQAEEIQKECKKYDLDTLIYHSQMRRSDRLSVLNSFQSNYYHTLIGCKALDEGFDVPDIDFGIIVSQTHTMRQRIQRLGRTIRKFKGKKQPEIYTLYTTDDEYHTLYEEQFDNPYIEAEWKEVK